MASDDYTTAREAAELLGVSITTFYVYVGRHKIRSQAIEGSRERLYWRQDLLGLRARRRSGREPASTAAPRGDLRRESALTLLTERGPFYRGEGAVELAETASLERVASILWNCDEQDVFGEDPPRAPSSFMAISRELEALPWLDRAALLLPMLEFCNPKSFDLSAAGAARTGGGVIRWLAAILLGAPTPPKEPIHLYLARQLKLGDMHADLIRRLLVLSADHGFEPGSYAVRAVAANGVTPWRSVMTGLLVSGGRRSSLSRHEAADRFLAEILAAPDPTAPVRRFLREGAEVPGFGSNIYGAVDPRAASILATLKTTMGDEPDYRRLTQVSDMMKETCGSHPSFPLVSLFVNRQVGLTYERSVFLVARAVGWIAHAIEQFEHGEAEHREGLYSGPLPKARG
jgi:citrate synthase